MKRVAHVSRMVDPGVVSLEDEIQGFLTTCGIVAGNKLGIEAGFGISYTIPEGSRLHLRLTAELVSDEESAAA